MKLVRIGVGGLSICLAAMTASAAEPSISCKDDPRVIEECRWVKGVVGSSVRGVVYLTLHHQESYVLGDEMLDDTILDLPGNYQAGEFEFCRLKDRLVEHVVDADGTTVLEPQAWGCVEAVRNIIPEPDRPTECAYAFSPETCPATKAKP